MSLYKIISIIQLISAVLLIVVVLVQSRGASLDQAFGGSGGFFMERRGIEKTLYYITLILAVVFLLSALSLLFVK
jgi:preprotein translocase subunit SecG